MYAEEVVQENRLRLEARLGLELRDYTFAEVEEFGNRMKDIEWGDGTTSRPLTPEEQAYVINERYLCRLSFRYWAERYGKLLMADKQLRPIRLWESQEQVLRVFEENERNGRTKTRIVLLKPRQVGGTAISELLIAHLVFMNSRTQGIIASDHEDNSLKLYQVLERIYDNLPGWLRPGILGRVKGKHLHFEPLASDVLVGAGNQVSTLGQGLTVDAAHLTEVSTWLPRNADSIDADLVPAFESSEKHHSFLILESTAAGAKGNYFHDQYQLAKKEVSGWKGVFIAWYMRPTYRHDPEGMTFKQSTLDMAERVKRETGRELDREQLAFYQFRRAYYEEKDDLETFFQEMCGTETEAWQTGLRSVFPVELRSRLRDRCQNPIAVYEVTKDAKLSSVPPEKWEALRPEDRDATNRLILWERPRYDSTYLVVLDTAYGIKDADASAIEVLRVGTRHEPDEQVAEFCSDWPPSDLAPIMELIGYLYTDKQAELPACAVIEVNPGSPGIVPQTDLIRRDYPNIYTWKRPLKTSGGWSKEVGWETNARTRPLVTEGGVSAVKSGDLRINSIWTIGEMDSYVNEPDARGRRHYTHAPGYKDDRLMALFIGSYVAHESDNRSMAEERRREAASPTSPTPEKEMWELMGGAVPGTTPEMLLEAWEARVLGDD